MHARARGGVGEHREVTREPRVRRRRRVDLHESGPLPDRAVVAVRAPQYLGQRTERFVGGFLRWRCRFVGVGCCSRTGPGAEKATTDAAPRKRAEVTEGALAGKRGPADEHAATD